MSDELAVKKAPFKVGAVGLAAKKAAIAIAKGETPATPAEQMKDRIGIVFDDSASMGSYITTAHQGVEEFLRSCRPNETAIAVYPMNSFSYPLTKDLPMLAMRIKSIRATGGTPLVQTLGSMLVAEPLTRAIVFSDGGPDTKDITAIVARKIPVDTVFIGNPHDTEAITFMRVLAERTGGVFLNFDPAKSNFRTAFKYLAPGYRAMLADKSFVSQLEGK